MIMGKQRAKHCLKARFLDAKRKGSLVPGVNDDGGDESDEESEEDETVGIGLPVGGCEFCGGNFPRLRNGETVILEDLSRGETSTSENNGNTVSRGRSQ